MHKHNLSLLFLLTVFLSSLNLSQSFTQIGFTLTDLVSSTNAGFGAEAALWGASSLVTPTKIYDICGPSMYLLGGYNILGTASTSYNHYFERKYTSLPSHNMIYYSFTFLAIDSWDFGVDSFYIQFDSRTVNGWTFNSASHNVDICGSPTKDLNSLQIYGRISHSRSTLTFRIVGLLDEPSSNESFGFRDINFFFVTTVGAVTEQVCGRPPSSMTLYTNQCRCVSNQYESLYLGSTSCGSCHSNCNDCFGPTERECYRCNGGATFNGYACIVACDLSCSTCFGQSQYECLTCPSTRFLATNNTCLSTCPSPLTQTSDGTNKYCESPCLLSQYLYWDSTCLSTCPSPLQPSTLGQFKLCSSPCTSAQYLHPNGTCLLTCNPLWQPRIENGVKFCDFPCNLSQFVYWNGLCKSTCNFPLKQYLEGSYKFCHHYCPSPQYLHINGSCLSDCRFPLTSSEQDGLRLCTYSCKSSEFLYWNGSCLPKCNTPFRVTLENANQICNPPCKDTSQYYYLETDECRSSCTSNRNPWADSTGLYRQCILKPKYIYIEPDTLLSSDAISLFAISKPFEYLRYLNIKAPPRLKEFMINPGKNVFSLRHGDKMSADTRSEFNKRPLPSIFESHGLHSSFLVNYWSEITSFTILLVLTIVFSFLENLSEKVGWRVLRAVSGRCKIVLKWNCLIVFIATSIGDIILYSALEFMTLHMDSFTSALSFFACLGMLAMIAVFTIDVVYLVPRRAFTRKDIAEKNPYDEYANFVLKYQEYQVVFRGFREDLTYNRYFFFIYTIRMTLPMVITCFLFEIPLIQTMLYVIISVLFIVYLYFIKPLNNRINHIQLLTIEVVGLIINLSLVILSILDLAEASTGAGGIFFGNVVIAGNVSVNILLIIFLVTKIITGAKIAEKLRLKQPRLAKASVLQLLYLPLQQSGMGFEQVQVVGFLDESANKSERELSNQEQKRGDEKDWNSEREEGNEVQHRILKKDSLHNTKGLREVRIEDANNVSFFDEIDDEIEIFGKKMV